MNIFKQAPAESLIHTLNTHTCWNDMEQTHKLHTLHALKTVQNIFWRECNEPGHVTSAAWVANPAFTKVLLQLHKIRRIWAPSGGHADGDELVEHVARKELFEEAGLKDLKMHYYGTAGIFDIDTHQVPANPKKNEPEHLHYDFRTLFLLDDQLPLPESPEGIETRWFTLDEAEEFCPSGGGRRRCLDKIRELAKQST